MRVFGRALLSRLVRVEPGEDGALLWSCAYFFFLLGSAFVIRPLREEMGILGGVKNLPWLFLGTLLSMLALSPVFSTLVSWLPRRRFVPLVGHFFSLNLLVFFGLLRFLPPGAKLHAARAFFIWASVFNLFAVSVFWGVMADCFRSDQGQRLFGFIGAFGTLGGLAGSSLSAGLVRPLGEQPLLLLAVVLLQAGVWSFRRLQRHPVQGLSSGPAPHNAQEIRSVPGPAPVPASLLYGPLSGLRLVLRSPYLLLISLYLLLFTISSTLAYFAQAQIAAAGIADSSARTAFFARIDLWVNLFALVLQGAVAGRILSAVGIGGTLMVLPVLTLIGFAVLGLSPTLTVLMLFQVARRATDYGISKPAREVLYTVVGRQEKYAAKSFIDTVVYRSGDALGAGAAGVLTGLHLGGKGLVVLAVGMAPLALLWAAVGLHLGRRT